MKISLILVTKNRVEELRPLLISLVKQEHQNLELIVVDQNSDNRLEEILALFQSRLLITRLRSEEGLSRGRNVGLASALGEIVTYPDDDCWYPDGLLRRVHDFFEKYPEIDGFTGRSEDDLGRSSGGNFGQLATPLTLRNVWRCGISYTIFLRSGLCGKVGQFDEELGVGARTPFGSGEETDYLIRAIQEGQRVHYLPDLIVRHPQPTAYTRHRREKALRYGAGMGRVLVKHRYGFLFKTNAIIRPVGGMLLSAFQFRFAKAANHLATARGRLTGLLTSRSPGTGVITSSPKSLLERKKMCE